MSAASATSGHYLPYAGDVSAREAWDALTANPAAVLIDVRTQPEWVFSGLPNLSALGKKTLPVSWKIYPTMEVNAAFVEQVKASVPNADTAIYFLCKTGGRSTDAAIAMTAAGYTQCYNISAGFEGDRDEHGHRGTINGWKATSLPWEQA